MVPPIESRLMSAKTPGPSQHAHQQTETTAYDAPPNRGFQAWMQVVGSFFLFLNSWYASSPSNAGCVLITIQGAL